MKGVIFSRSWMRLLSVCSTYIHQQNAVSKELVRVAVMVGGLRATTQTG